MVGWDYFGPHGNATDTMPSNQHCPACRAPTHDIDGIERCTECSWVYPLGAD